MPAPTGRLHDHVTHDTSRPASTGIGGQLVHFSSLLQSVGAILAVPVSIIGAYSVYHSHFSTDVFCQNLRASIITTLDKNLDADARRVLVRRDVEEFGNKCGRSDPDAKAAFQVLIDRPSEEVRAASATPPEAAGHVEAAANPGRAVPPPARKVSRPVAPVKVAVVNEAPKPPVIAAEPDVAADPPAPVAPPVTLARRDAHADGATLSPQSIVAAPLPAIPASIAVNDEYRPAPEPVRADGRPPRPIPPAAIPLLEGFPGRDVPLVVPVTQAHADEVPYPAPPGAAETHGGSLLERVPVLGAVFGALRVPGWLR